MSNWSTFSYLCQRLLISINFIIFNVGQFTLLLLTCFNYHIHQLSLNFVNYRQLLSIFDPFWRSYFQLQWEDSRDGHGQMLFHYNHENWRLWTIKEILPTISQIVREEFLSLSEVLQLAKNHKLFHCSISHIDTMHCIPMYNSNQDNASFRMIFR